MQTISEILLPYQKAFFANKKRRKLWISSRQVGKSVCIAAILTYKALSKQNGLSLCISTGSRAASEIIRKCQQFAEAVKQLSGGQIDYSASFDAIKFSNGSRILSLPSSTDGANLRGFTAQCVCVDEAAYVWHLDTILQAINPTLSRDPNAELILTTTPAGKNGAFWELYCQAKTSDEWYVQTTSIHDAIADGLKTDLDSLHSLCPDPNVFAQEYECQFSDTQNSLIDINLLQWFIEPSTYVDYFMGADWARSNDGTSLVVVGRTKDGKLDVVENVCLHNVEYAKQIAVATDMFKRFQPKAFYGDAGGLGSPLMEQLNRTVSTRIKGISFTATNKPEMYEYFRKCVFDRKLRIRQTYKQVFLDDISLVRQTISDSGKTSYDAIRANGSHADSMSALVLALHAERDNRQQMSTPQSFARQSPLGAYTRRF